MTPDDFRRLALSLPETSENTHMHHPDFRADGKIFATLGSPDPGSGMVKLTPEQQHDFMQRSPATFHPAAGAWGRSGSTLVDLAAADESLVEQALTIACRQAKQKSVAKRPGRRASS